MTFEESLLQASKMTNRASIEARFPLGEGRILKPPNSWKVFLKTPCTLETKVSRTGTNSLHDAKKNLTSHVPYSWGSQDPTVIVFSGQQTRIMPSSVARRSWAEGLITHKKTHFLVPLMPYSSSLRARYPRSEGLGSLMNYIFKRTKCRRVAHMKPVTLDWRINHHGRKHFFRPPQWWNVYVKSRNLHPSFS